MKGDRMEKRSSFGSIVRKRLSDITNSMPQPKTPARDEKLSPINSSSKDHIGHLLKENMALVRLIEDKNKIIELSGVQLQKFQFNLQKMQMQNWTLARANSQMLAEINLGKEKVKALQHELVCKEALIKAKNLEFQNQLKMNGQKNSSQVPHEQVTRPNNKPCTGTRRRSVRSQSLGPSTTSQQNADKETVENKRRCLRRQSARFKSEQPEPKENLFEIDAANFASGGPLDTPMHEAGPNLLDSSIKIDEKDENCESEFKPKESQRTSFGRPVRRVAEKVQSYKEIPLNIKMRRT
ncbi:hypothetical protein LguiA_012318 [Lonicera macranthoides]